jgi:hypothetical protein
MAAFPNSSANFLVQPSHGRLRQVVERAARRRRGQLLLDGVKGHRDFPSRAASLQEDQVPFAGAEIRHGRPGVGESRAFCRHVQAEPGEPKALPARVPLQDPVNPQAGDVVGPPAPLPGRKVSRAAPQATLPGIGTSAEGQGASRDARNGLNAKGCIIKTATAPPAAGSRGGQRT